MKAGDVSGGRTSSRESWLSAPLSDPNAALWASITPPANPNIATLVRRRAASFSLDLLAHHLYLRFPNLFSSRAPARTAILGAAVAFGAALGTAGYLSLKSQLGAAAAADAAPSAASLEVAATEAAMTDDGALAAARQGQTELSEPASAPASPLGAAAPGAPARAATSEPTGERLRAADRADAADETPAGARSAKGRLRAGDAADETRASTATAAKAKRASKKRGKAAGRRASQRRVRAALD